MVCLWWAGINLLSVAIYCADSRAGQLMLLNGLTGQESDAHDWNNLLTRWGLLQHDIGIARGMRAPSRLDVLPYQCRSIGKVRHESLFPTLCRRIV
jgi:hypothetical protein